MSKAWQIYWGTWIVAGFVIPETWALVSRKPNTLSDTVWHWFGVHQGVPIWHWSVLHLALLAFVVWLAGHFAFGIWR